MTRSMIVTHVAEGAGTGQAEERGQHEINHLRADDVLRSVCINHGVTRTELLSRSRTRYIVRARWTAMLVLREIARWSLPRIAALLRRDHSTVINGIRTAITCMRDDADYRDAVRRVLADAVAARGQDRRS